jgi:hypothetical protein
MSEGGGEGVLGEGLNISRHFVETVKKTTKNVDDIRLYTERYLGFECRCANHTRHASLSFVLRKAERQRGILARLFKRKLRVLHVTTRGDT